MVPDAIPALKPQQPGKDAGKDILAEQPAYDLIELFFFAYRDFVSDPDRILADFGFGRAHHRVLHFVDRQPGLTIADLLAMSDGDARDHVRRIVFGPEDSR